MNQALGLIREIGWTGLLDIVFVTLWIYTILVWFKRTRAAFVLTGIIIVAAVYLLARQLNLILTTSVLQGFFAVILVAVIVIFQEELRHFFEQVAVWSLNRKLGRRRVMRTPRKEVEVLVRTLTDLAREHIGVLIVIRGLDPIVRHLDGGEDLNGELSEPLLKSLFDPHSMGHDGAVVIERDRVTRFSCHLPLSKNFQKLQRSGTRHAAALGLAELTDALCLAVSEEQGTISVARAGDIQPISDPGALSVLLEQFYQEVLPGHETRPFRDFFAKNYQEKAIALVTAVALWVVLVRESKIVAVPFQTPVEYTGLPMGLAVTELYPRTVEVTLSGTRRDFYLFNKRQLRARVRMLDADEGTRTITLSEADVAYPPNMTLVQVNPKRITVHVETVSHPAPGPAAQEPAVAE